jgi:hypothetical protein
MALALSIIILAIMIVMSYAACVICYERRVGRYESRKKK